MRMLIHRKGKYAVQGGSASSVGYLLMSHSRERRVILFDVALVQRVNDSLEILEKTHE